MEPPEATLERLNMTPAQHQYRTEFLKSKEWSRIRTKRIQQQRKIHGFDRCECCSVPFLNSGEWRNVHHVTYPEDWYDTTVEQIRLVCVPCHKLFHSIRISPMNSIEETWGVTKYICRDHIRERQHDWNERLSKRLKRKSKPYIRKKYDMFFTSFTVFCTVCSYDYR